MKDNRMDNIVECAYNMDNGYVEVWFTDGNMLQIKCEEVEAALRTTEQSLAKLCFVNRKSSKSEGKFPTFRSGNPHYPKETCREFSLFSLSSRKESSIHCFLPNRVIRVRLCQRLPERFAFNVLSFDSAPAPG